MRTREEAVQQVEAEHAEWRALLAEIGTEHMLEPGPMGEWSFKDMVEHLLYWQKRWLARIAAGPDGADPEKPWPAELAAVSEIDEWSGINAWIRTEQGDRPLEVVLADMDRQYERFADVLADMPEEDLLTPGAFGGEQALVDIDLFEHYHEEHEPAVRAWLAAR